MDVLCVGFGRVGVSVAQAFEGMRRACRPARNPVQLARACAMN